MFHLHFHGPANDPSIDASYGGVEFACALNVAGLISFSRFDFQQFTAGVVSSRSVNFQEKS
jgi:hypothetical protein